MQLKSEIRMHVKDCIQSYTKSYVAKSRSNLNIRGVCFGVLKFNREIVVTPAVKASLYLTFMFSAYERSSLQSSSYLFSISFKFLRQNQKFKRQKGETNRRCLF